MTVTAVVGAQWGDEGKGRIIDYLAQRADMVIRFQGGDNAGHTVVNEYGRFRMHLVPSGIFNPHTRCIVGTGTVVNLDTILRELADLKAAGVDTSNFWISERAHLIMPYHRTLDGLEERARGKGAIGTTKRGIGPVYADKAARNGLRLGELRYPERLKARLKQVLPRVNRTLEFFGEKTVTMDEMLDLCRNWQVQLGDRIVDTLPMIRDAVLGGQMVLLEGQLGVMRDLDWGIYPYVTSSNPLASFGAVGAGFPTQYIDQVIGVVKAYSTCVGAGPFPVELHDEIGNHIRERGGEYGATTGRPRRCGWFDGVAIRYAAWLQGFTGIAVTKLDVLDDLPELKICIGYRLPSGEVIDYVPDTPLLEQVEPVYENWPGWQAPTTECRTWESLPANAQHYLRRLEELASAPLRYVSVGPEREQIVIVEQ
ncbi:MAG TPA: adenylosuccinate synthase [Anaerolineae bacterium]|nr:adenylosuccinate synthase [Anaerolineae bacterium]HIQ04275.1 adenylosuccinate synthase [Anaerolineae bacterium]